MDRKRKHYTEEENRKIRELYSQGYSASMILEKIGRGNRSSWSAASWLSVMQKRLNLPKRGVGFRSIKRIQKPNLEKQEAKRINRIEHLKRLIPQGESQVAKWKEELESLCVDKTSEASKC